MLLAGDDPPPECTVMGEKFFIQFLGSPYSPRPECMFGYERIYLLISKPGGSSPGDHLYQNINNNVPPTIDK